jgi:hypothetical protein
MIRPDAQAFFGAAHKLVLTPGISDEALNA